MPACENLYCRNQQKNSPCQGPIQLSLYEIRSGNRKFDSGLQIIKYQHYEKVIYIIRLVSVYPVRYSPDTHLQVRPAKKHYALQAGGQSYTDCRLRRPLKYESYYDDEYHDGQVINYDYGQLSFICVNNILDGFSIEGSDFTVQILDKHTVRIGDSIEELIRKFSAQEAWFKQRGKQILLFSKMENCDAFYDLPLVFEYGSDGTITSIWQTN